MNQRGRICETDTDFTSSNRKAWEITFSTRFAERLILWRGAWENVDASNPRERPILFAVGMAGILALICYALFRQRDSFLVRGSTGALALLAVSAVTTRWVKVSLHVAAAALAATALILLGSVVGWCLAAVVPVLAWSRVTLGRHTPVEVGVGLVFGALAGLAIHLV